MRRLLPASLCCVAILASPARADNVLAGLDLYQVDANVSVQNFGGPTTIPAGFFDPGSDPFVGTVRLDGVPLPGYPGCTGDFGITNVIIERKATSNTPVVPSTDTVPIEIVQLSLVSVNPITVTYSGGLNPEFWEFHVIPSPTPPGQGTMTLKHSIAPGGTFDSQLPVRPQFVFRRLSDSATRVLDAGNPSFSSFFDVFVEIDIPWRHTSDPSEVAQAGCKSNFTGSYDGHPVVSQWVGQNGLWGLRPAPPERPVPSRPATWGTLKAIYR